MLVVWLVSGIGLLVAKRGNPGAKEGSRLSALVTPIYLGLAALGVLAALRLPVALVSLPGILPVAIFVFGLGLAMQWYACISRQRFIQNFAVGGLLAMIGLSLSFGNWDSLLIMGAPACAITIWRLRAAASSSQ
jgi:hypothetical protein